MTPLAAFVGAVIGCTLGALIAGPIGAVVGAFGCGIFGALAAGLAVAIVTPDEWDDDEPDEPHWANP